MQEVILIIFVMFSNGEGQLREYPMENMGQCLKVLEQTQIKLPHTDNGHEGVAIVSCGHKEKGGK